MKAAQRDYRVGGPEAARAASAGLVEAEWFRPPIDPHRLRELQVRGNTRAAIDTVAWARALGRVRLFGVPLAGHLVGHPGLCRLRHSVRRGRRLPLA